MDPEKVLVLVLNVAEMSQAFSIGVFLLLLNRKKKNSLRLLGLVLLMLGLHLLPDVINAFYRSLPTSTGFFILVPVFLYAYVNEVSILPKSKFLKSIILLGLLGLVVDITIYLISIGKNGTIHPILNFTHNLLVLIFIVGIFTMIYLRAKRTNKALKNQYSSLEHKDLSWVVYLMKFVLGLLLFTIVGSFSDLIPESYENSILAAYGIFLTYWIAYNGLLQQTSQNLIPESKTTKHEGVSQKTANGITKEREIDFSKYQIIFKKVKALMDQEQLFLNPNLTIVNVSEQVGEHPRLISKVINTLNNENFNSFVNRYRVEQAKTMLLNGQSNRLNIEGVGSQSGFKSNSSFYAAFKKMRA